MRGHRKKILLWGGAPGCITGMMLGLMMALFLPGLSGFLPDFIYLLLFIGPQMFSVLMGRLWTVTVSEIFPTLLCLEFHTLIVMGVSWLMATIILFGLIGTLVGLASVALYSALVNN